jgi:YD repeat-containing protein
LSLPAVSHPPSYLLQICQALIPDPLDNETEQTYDKANRLKEVILPDPDGTGPLGRPNTVYAYDAAGRLLSLTDPADNTTTWLYDALGRVNSETNELEKTRSFEYDGAGRLTKRIDRRTGYAIEFEYNHFDHVTYEHWYDGANLVLQR